MAKTLSSFGKEFAAARARGDKEFEFNGKKYNTRLASEEKPRPKAEVKQEPEVKQEAEVKESARRTTSMPAGSLMGAIARSQGAESTFPEPTQAVVGQKAARQREEMGNQFSNLGRKIGKYLGPQSTRDRIAAEDAEEEAKRKLSDEGIGMKKGGYVRKADGIAQRGKTKGKIY